MSEARTILGKNRKIIMRESIRSILCRCARLLHPPSCVESHAAIKRHVHRAILLHRLIAQNARSRLGQKRDRERVYSHFRARLSRCSAKLHAKSVRLPGTKRIVPIAHHHQHNCMLWCASNNCASPASQASSAQCSIVVVCGGNCP